jgi:dihydroflavonol-4-reductase
VTAPVLITGAGGFVGGAVLERLLRAGLEVRALVRTPETAERVRRAGAEPVSGDILDGECLTGAMRGCELVFHVAGLNKMCLPDPAPLMRNNVEGSVSVVRAAARAGVRRIVYTSSAATLDSAPATPGSGNGERRFLSEYERSKYEAERLVFELAPRLGVELMCLNPSSVQGPGRTTGTARWLISYANGRLHWLVDAPVSLVDVADCAEAHLLAATRGEPLRPYVISGSTQRISEMVHTLGTVAGHTYPVRFLPPGPAVAAASLLGAGFRAAGRRAPVCREMLRTLAHGHAYDGAPAALELGFTYTPLAETLRRALAWYMENGHVRPSPAPEHPGGPVHPGS